MIFRCGSRRRPRWLSFLLEDKIGEESREGGPEQGQRTACSCLTTSVLVQGNLRRKSWSLSSTGRGYVTKGGQWGVGASLTPLGHFRSLRWFGDTYSSCRQEEVRTSHTGHEEGRSEHRLALSLFSVRFEIASRFTSNPVSSF